MHWRVAYWIESQSGLDVVILEKSRNVDYISIQSSEIIKMTSVLMLLFSDKNT